MADQDADARTQTFHIRMSGDAPQSSGRRSARKSERPRLPASSPLFNRNKSDMISYEDLLVAQYLDELKRQKTEVPRDRPGVPSPYLQRLPHSHLRFRRNRPMSAIVGRLSSGKPKIDAKFIADANLWDPASPRHGRMRPASAPVKRFRPQSGFSQRSRPPSGRKPTFAQQPHLIKAYAYPNGSRDQFIHAAAPNMKILLEYATDKLGLPFAARRVFLEDGTEVLHEDDIPTNADIYISMGEKYKDPFQSTKRNMINRKDSLWTLMGIVLPEKGRKKGVKTKLSKRMRALCDKKRVRILVFKNGNCIEPAEVVADLAQLEEFLDLCTLRVGLGAPAKTAFDVEGNKITDLSSIPYLFDEDEVDASQGKTPIRGPLWISSGTKPHWEGMEGFLQKKLHVFKDSLNKATKYKTDIDSALDNEESISDPNIGKMTVDQLYEASADVEDDIGKWKEKIKFTQGQLGIVQTQMNAEDDEQFRQAEVEGIKIRVFDNGHGDGEFEYFFHIERRFRGQVHKRWMMERLLDELSGTKFSSQSSRNLKSVAQKLYNQYGSEIKAVSDLMPDQSVWMSFGEPFISPFTYCLQVQFEKATKVTSEGGAELIVREVIVGPEQEAMVKDASKWEGTIGFPALYEVDEAKMLEYDPERIAYMLETAEVDSRSHYLLHKDQHDFALYPEICVTEKDKGYPRNQLFVISKNGVIHCKAAPQMCLSVSDMKVEAQMFDREANVEGFVVTFQKKMVGNPCQTWRFSANKASIVCEAYPNLCLTYLGNKMGDDETYMNKVPQGTKVGERIYLVLADPLPKKDQAAQRFALKQERFDNIGQWKFTEASNPEWNKQAYSWPVRKDGSLNEDYDWPMEGFLLPYAPPLHKSSKQQGVSVTPVRLRVLKNGERSTENAVSIVGPNLSNKQFWHCLLKDKKQKLPADIDEDDGDFDIHRMELQMFLDQCTGLLNLPFAGRRLFDTNGDEVFSLQALQRDQLVYVSCGEVWSDPRLSKSEQKRRFLLSQLASDVEKIQHYCSLRNPEDYVLEVGGPLMPKTPLIVNKEWSRDDMERAESGLARHDPLQEVSHDETQEAQPSQDPSNLSAHERAHQKAEKRHQTLKWPWERLVNVNNSLDNEDPEANKYSDPDMYQKFKPQSSPRIARDSFQKFSFEDGYIAVQGNRALVLSVNETEGRSASLVLAKRLPDDTHQRWLIRDNGEIRARYNQQLVMTVSLPADTNKLVTFDYCPVTLQTRRNNQFGKAHQRWRYDADTGLIHAFYAELPDKEITAANKADVCTYAISQAVDIDQPGYTVDITSSKHGDLELPVCVSCARAMRGRYKVQKMTENTPFHCSMGEAKAMKIRQVGSFKVLNNKVDLSTFEADFALRYWQDTLENLRQQTSIHTITKEINTARTVRTVKVMAYKNGEGRLHKGEVICGSSIEGILFQCTHRLGMTNAARRIYLEDGDLVLDIEDLTRHAVESCKNEMINMVLLQRLQAGDGDLDNRLKDMDNEAVRLERLQQAANQDVPEQMKKSRNLIKSTGNKDHDRGRGEDDEKEEDENEEDDGETGDLDSEEARKIRSEREKVLANMKLPALDIILRAPIEVWVSSGKAFVSPDVVESKEESRTKKRQFRAQVCLALDIDKHVLRQMKGRRLEKMQPGVYKSTLSSKQPVVIEKHWQEPSVMEQEKHHSVHKLQAHLGEIQANQASKGSDMININLGGRLYMQPNMKRILVYPNGETADRSEYVWGSSLDEILQSATQKLGLWRQAKYLYSLDGQKIEEFEDIERDQVMCVSTGKSFMQPTNQKVHIEIKANWGRARKRYGKKATDVVVDVEKNPKVDVDPFGPPLLALPPDTNPPKLEQGTKPANQ